MRGWRSLALVLLGMVMAISCGREAPELNVLIIAVDTLRADHLGCYGYSRDTTSEIDRLARSGVLCTRCLSSAPWTLPSFSTIFTSLHPTQHGATAVKTHMRDSFPTLAGILKENGYATGAIVNAPALKPANGVARGFDFYHMTPLDGRNAAGTTRDALEWIDGVEDSSFFMFAHYFDPHLSYSPPPPYDRLYFPGYRGRIGNSFNLEGFSRVRDSMFVQMQDLEEDDWKQIVALYDGEIAFTDSAVGMLLEGLEDRGILENTLIVFLSDHGEEFFEHGGFEHGHTLYDELIQVPLVFSLPGVLPQNVSIERQVRLLDVTPTILDMLDIPLEPHFEGVSLKPLLMGKGTLSSIGRDLLPPEAAYAEAMMHSTEQKCISVYPWKLTHWMMSEEQTLFDLEADPHEMNDLAGRAAEPLARLDNQLHHALFGMQDTWYIELGAEEQSHTFDISIVAEKQLMPGSITLSKILDSSGRLAVDQEPLNLVRSRSALELRNFGIKGTVTLAFRVEPRRFPVEFDFRIDGNPAAGATFLGSSHSNPDQMPFIQRGKRSQTLSEGRPKGPLTPPYVLVWFERAAYRGENYLRLDEETKKELRSLGYIQ
jgi:arylsulfatase A-like enzyme